jgi:hypothetical protein
MMTDDAAWPLAQHFCRTHYADLPASAVECALRDILDRQVRRLACTYSLSAALMTAIGRLAAISSY